MSHDYSKIKIFLKLLLGNLFRRKGKDQIYIEKNHDRLMNITVQYFFNIPKKMILTELL